MDKDQFPMRLNKFLALKGFATRRGADELIERGTVFVNGRRASLGEKVTEKDRVEIQNYAEKEYRYALYHKPRGIITHSPESHETDIMSQIQHDHSIRGLFPIGRLDKDSEGLMILTDDGRITERLLNPEHAHEREYEVLLDKRVTQTFCNRLSKGVRIEGYITKPARAVLDEGNPYLLRITLTEGKKHQVRRMCAALGYQVRALRRVRILDLTLKNIRPGDVRLLSKKDSMRLKKSLGLN